MKKFTVTQKTITCDATHNYAEVNLIYVRDNTTGYEKMFNNMREATNYVARNS